MAEAMRGADAVIHLAGIASEAPWVDLLRVNIDGTRIVLEAAREAGVRSVLLASSIHAAGFLLSAEVADSSALVPRPDSYYGVTKAAMESLGIRNAPDWFPLAAGEAIGYVPQDDAGAERRRRGEVVSGEPDRAEPIGGTLTRPDHPIGER